jgi:hypothetical protein
MYKMLHQPNQRQDEKTNSSLEERRVKTTANTITDAPIDNPLLQQQASKRPFQA